MKLGYFWYESFEEKRRKIEIECGVSDKQILLKGEINFDGVFFIVMKCCELYFFKEWEKY